MFVCFQAVGRVPALRQWRSRTGWHRARPLPVPVGVSGVSRGSVAPGRCQQGGVCCQHSWQMLGLGALSWCPASPTDPPQGLAFGWGLACGYPHHPCVRCPLAGGHSWLRSFGACVPGSCLPPPQALLTSACSPPTAPSSPGWHLCPQPPRRRAAFGHCFHPPHTRALCHPPSSGVPGPVPAPSPLPSLPSPASLGMAPRALRPGSVSGQPGGAGPPGAGHRAPRAPTAPLKIGH